MIIMIWPPSAALQVYMQAKESIYKCVRKHFELLCWIMALALLFFLPESKSETSLCVFSLLGLGHCPGCGIGHAIHYALHFQLALSFQHHPFGIFGVMVIFIRIYQLAKTLKPTYETEPH